MSLILQNEIVNSEAGPQLHHHLLKNPILIQELNGMDDMAVVRKLTRIEALIRRLETGFQ